MKKTALTCTAACLALASFAQRHYSKFDYEASLKKAPYSFLWADAGKLAIKQTEVSVDEYFGFLEAITRDSNSSYVMSMKPSRNSPVYPFMDTSNVLVSVDEDDPEYKKISWLDEEKMEKQGREEALMKKVGYDDYFKMYKMPMTGISYEQALEYAKWCTIIANNALYKAAKHPADIKQVVIYRLPTPSEFERIFRNGLENCVDKKDPNKCAKVTGYLKEARNEKGCALANVAGKDTCKENLKVIAVYGVNHLHPVYVYNPNFAGTYNMMGNAAEMTSEKGKAMGGSYLTTAKESQPGMVQNYTQPEAWLGFRLVGEVVPLDGTTCYFTGDGKFVMKK